MLQPFGRHGDQGRVVFLACPLNEGVAGNPAGGAVGEVDQIVGLAALTVVEAGVEDGDPRRPALEVMAAGAAFEARVGDGQAAIVADIERVGAVAVGAAAEAAEGRMIDRDAAIRIAGGEDSALAIGEQRFRDVQIALLDPDAGTIAVRHCHVGEDQAFDARRSAAQHERRLALAHHAIERDRPRRRGGEDNITRFLHSALPVSSRCDPDCAASLADRRHRVGQRRMAFACLGDGEGRTWRGLASDGAGEGESKAEGHAKSDWSASDHKRGNTPPADRREAG